MRFPRIARCFLAAGMVVAAAAPPPLAPKTATPPPQTPQGKPLPQKHPRTLVNQANTLFKNYFITFT